MRQVQEEEVAKLQAASQATSEVDVARAQPHLSSALSEICAQCVPGYPGQWRSVSIQVCRPELVGSAQH